MPTAAPAVRPLIQPMAGAAAGEPRAGRPRNAGPYRGPRDADLLRRLHDEHAAALRAFAARQLGGDHAAADDVVQETLLRAWQHPEVLDQADGSVREWLFTVARRLVIDQHRHRHRHPEVLTDDPAAAPSAPVGDDGIGRLADREALLAAMRTLRPEHRGVLVECYFRGSSVTQAAARLGIAEGTVKSRAHYALKALRAALLEEGMPR